MRERPQLPKLRTRVRFPSPAPAKVLLDRPVFSTLVGPALGIGPPVSRSYAGEWILEIGDVTAMARAVHQLVEAGDLAAAERLLPPTSAYPLTPQAASAAGAD